MTQAIQELTKQHTIQSSELYSDIELTEEEKAEAIERALAEARHAKYAAINHKKWLEKMCEPVTYKEYTSAELYNYLKATEGFTIDPDNQEVVRILCQYFANDPAFEQQGRSLKKGLLLRGPLGVGKTHLLELFRNNQKQSYQVTSCMDVEGLYAKNGTDQNEKTREEGLSKFYNNINLPACNQYGHQQLGFCFDDLGQENTATKYFGTERNVMEEVLSQRYRRHLFTSTHITTNLTADDIEKRYGDRVRDRMREMFNMIGYPSTAKSRRI